MSKVAITGRFADTNDVVRVHRISPSRQAWLEEQLSEIEAGRSSQPTKVGSRVPPATRVRPSSHKASAAKNLTSAKKR